MLFSAESDLLESLLSLISTADVDCDAQMLEAGSLCEEPDDIVYSERLFSASVGLNYTCR